MRKRMRHLKTATKVALYWDKATDLASKANYDDALKYLEKIEALTDSLPDVLVLKGLMYLRLQREEECIKVMLKAVEKISGYGKYSDFDKLYLKGYAALCCERAAANLGMQNKKIIDVDYREIKPEKVKRHLRQNFPFRKQ